MHLSKLTIQGYKNFGQKFEIDLSEGLNVLVGENSIGKTAIIDAIKHLIPEDDYRGPISESDFYRPFISKSKRSDSFLIHGKFEGLSKNNIVAFLPWTDIEGNASLTFQVDNKTNYKGRYKPLLWGGASRSSMFEKELFDAIDCVYLPPLRDAEAKLREGKTSRLARLLKNINKESLEEAQKNDKLHRLEQEVKKFNFDLATNPDGSILKANNLIKERLSEAIGDVFGQDTHIQFSETNFNRIVESLRLFFFPQIGIDTSVEDFRSLEENSLGYNNLLYIATVLAELTFSDNTCFYKILLIEEPEAHLHPQLQIRLLKYLEKIAKGSNVQVVVTTHSPVLAASASINSLIHLSKREIGNEYIHTAVPLKSCKLDKSTDFVNRWLDATKSTLLFARGVILVEGITEAILVPELAKFVLAEFNNSLVEEVSRELLPFDLNNKQIKLIRNRNLKVKEKDFDSNGPDIVNILKEKFIDLGKGVLPISLEDGGISVINMNGIYFKHFMQFFCNFEGKNGTNIPVLCSGITDNDPPKYIDDDKKKPSKPTPSNPIVGKNPALKLIRTIKKSQFSRLYTNSLKTFEYDLAMEAGNMNVMVPVAKSLVETDGSIKKTFEKHEKVNWADEKDENVRAEAAYHLLTNIDKGIFSQALADYCITKKVSLTVPDYIKRAVIWACGGNPDDA